jgi:hypothetical protein
MDPLQVTCPHCRAPLRLLIQTLPARTNCPHCRAAITLTPGGHAAVPHRDAEEPGPSSRLVLAAVSLVLLTAFAGAGIALASFCFSGDSPAHAANSTRPARNSAASTPLPPELVAEQRAQKAREAMERGVAYLRRELRAKPFRTAYHHIGGSNLGAAALAGLTLLECGVPRNDPDVTHVASAIRQAGAKVSNTYTLSLSILFLDRLEDRADKNLIRDLALNLIAGQTAEGAWSYRTPALSPEAREEWLAGLRGERTMPEPWAPKVNETNSNTQFAVLGLWAARKYGAPVEQALRRSDAYFREQQGPDGSWGYTKRLKVRRDSMTCTGLLALAIGRGLDKAPATPAQDPAIDKGLRYLAAALKRVAPVPVEEKERRLKEAAELAEAAVLWTSLTPVERKRLAKRNGASIKWRGALVDADARGDLYFLWSVERVAVLYNLKTVGQIDWYAWGSKLLLANQQSDGSWRERLPGIPDTCFALLFLRRANLIKDLTERLQGSLGLAADLGARNNPGGRKGP